MEQEIGTWDSVLLENLSEDSFINNIHQRYKRDYIYTYIGTSVVAVNPYRHISEHTSEIIRAYGSKGIFQLPPHIYGLANLAYQSLKNQSEDQCIILLGESGSGKTESFKMVVNFLTHIQETQKNKAKCQMDTVRRRTSSSFSANFVACPSSRRKKQSPASQHMAATPESVIRVRAESSDRSSRKNLREKVVDFDFSHHKSTENFTEDPLQRHERASFVATTIPAKSCFKHNYNEASSIRHKAAMMNDKVLFDASTNVSMGKFSSGSNCDATPYNITVKAPTSYSSIPTSSTTGCRQCGHSKCTQQRSFEVDDKACGSGNSISYKLKADCKTRGSCSSLVRQHSNESTVGRELFPNFALSSSRISLFDAHKLNQMYGESIKGNRHTSCSSVIVQCRNPKMRECVTCADVFLEAMGNATTLKNNNSSRYGKFFDIEIDFKGDPIGIHITHYPHHTLKPWREKFSYILSAFVGS